MKYLSKVNDLPLYDTDFYKLSKKYRLEVLLVHSKIRTAHNIMVRLKIHLVNGSWFLTND